MTTLSSKKPTIIIAAHNEESVIRDTLTLIDGLSNSPLQIIVVCNGCTDKTQQIVEQEFPSIFCTSLNKASKSLAIRHAETFSIGYPRLYLDADINMSLDGAIKLIEIADKHEGPVLLTPSSSIDFSNISNYVKSYYKAWYATSFVQQLGFGSGAYILNKQARKRFGEWPELISDDGYLRAIFTQSEIMIANDIEVAVKAPKTLRSLIGVKTRSKFGNLELKKYLKQKNIARASNSTNQTNALTQSKITVSLTTKLVYIVVNCIALSNAHIKTFTGTFKWYRDGSNR